MKPALHHIRDPCSNERVYFTPSLLAGKPLQILLLKLFFVIIALILFIDSYSQTCTGSVGDPIVNITFGSGSNQFGPPLPANTTSSLSYQGDNCPSDGSYAITNYTSGCWPSDVKWHTATDHTGNANGYYMLINASYTPSDFYIQTVSGLCEGTQYQFAAWLMNMCSNGGEDPDIIMTIETTGGSILATYQTGKVPVINPATWAQYGFNFTTPAGISSVVLRMHNNAPGGVGNDVGLDDITFRPIGPSVAIHAASETTDTISLCLNSNEIVHLQSDIEACYVSNAYQWQTSTDNGVSWRDIERATQNTFALNASVAGTFLYRLSVAELNNIGITTCRVTSKPIILIVYPNDQRTISISKQPDVVCEGNVITFSAQAGFAGNTPSLEWQVNGVYTGVNASSFTSNTLTTGDRVSCLLTSSLPCNSPALSNTIVVTINQKVSSTIDTAICEGESYAGYNASGTYTDVLTGSNGCDSVRVLNLVVDTKQQTSEDTTICYGSNYFGHSSSGTYSQVYTAANGCDSVHTIHLIVLPDINRKVWNDTLLCTGDTLLVTPGEWASYRWQDGSTASHYTITKGGSYSVDVSNQCGNVTKVIHVVEQVCNVAFPSAFTPNGDGRNDVFKVVNGYNLSYYHFIVYNRWGQQLFETSDWGKGWSGLIKGKQADNGAYIWLCEYKRAGDVRTTIIKGAVTLFR